MTIESIKIDQDYQNNDIFHICNPATANKNDNEMLILFFFFFLNIGAFVQ